LLEELVVGVNRLEAGLAVVRHVEELSGVGGERREELDELDGDVGGGLDDGEGEGSVCIEVEHGEGQSGVRGAVGEAPVVERESLLVGGALVGGLSDPTPQLRCSTSQRDGCAVGLGSDDDVLGSEIVTSEVNDLLLVDLVLFVFLTSTEKMKREVMIRMFHVIHEFAE